MALANYIVTLPDGSTGSLDVFYDSILSGDIEVTDAGYVLSDGTTLPTQGEPYLGVTEEDLISLMSPYLSDTGGGVSSARSEVVNDTVEQDSDSGLLSSDSLSNGHLYKLVVIGLLAYIIVNK